ncbi:MAG: hypothetical protein HYV33_03215 [Candidatus Kerfeldbacteria bacterium]|nr:hypothetical protein [Candidatus Kerfeldbacteria bacterium]
MNEIRNTENGKPFCWQSKPILRLIRETYTRKRLCTAIAIYTVLTELSSNQNTQAYCQAYYIDIANHMGKSSSTAKRYLNEFVIMGIVRKQHRYQKNNPKMLARTKWFLLSLPVQHKTPTSVHNNNKPPSQNNEPVIEEHTKNNLYKKGESSIKEKTIQELVNWFSNARRVDIATREYAQNLIGKYGIEKVKRSMDIHGSQGYGNEIDAFHKHLKDDLIGCGCNVPLSAFYPR